MIIENEKLNFNQINNLIDEISKKIINSKSQNICIALIGDLGTGKTAFAKRLLANLGVKEHVKSPTFTYMIEYSSIIDIVHFDVYRINNEDELYDIGFFDYVDNENLVLIEWADLIPNSLPENAFYFEIKHCDLENRYISIYTKKDGEKTYVDFYNYNFN